MLKLRDLVIIAAFIGGAFLFNLLAFPYIKGIVKEESVTPEPTPIVEVIEDSQLAELEDEVQRLQTELDRFNESVPLTCLKAELWVSGHDYGGTYVVGESELCGYNIGWSAVYGPSIQAYMDSLNRQISELQASNESI